MVSYNNDPALKQKCLDLILQHRHLKGIDNKHLPQQHGEDRPPFYETELGLPGWLFVTEFPVEVHLPKELAKSWKYDYLSAIPVGVDLSRVLLAFNYWILTDSVYGEWQYFTEDSKGIGYQIIRLYSSMLYGVMQQEEYDRERFRLWCITKDTMEISHPKYWSDAAVKERKDKYRFNSYVQKPLIEMPTNWLNKYDEKGEEDLNKFVLAMRECLLSLLRNASSI